MGEPSDLTDTTPSLDKEPTEHLVRRVMQRDPEADLLQNASVEFRSAEFVLLQRRCTTLRGDLGRRIRAVRLPAVGAGHEGHH